MTNELEKTFFDTFGIEPKFKGYSNTEELSTGGVIPCGNIKYFNTIEEMDRANYWCFNMWELDNEDKEYPQITDRILLELIFLQPLSIEFKYPRNIEELKDTLLEYYIEKLSLFAEPSEAEIFTHQVRALFEEEK